MSGCRAELASGQWWGWCGETDMGQTAPALCTECGGRYIRADVDRSKTIMDERTVEAAARAAETFTGKDPDEAHLYFSLIKSGYRILGCVLFIILGFATNEMLLSYGASMFFAAEVLSITEELV